MKEELARARKRRSPLVAFTCYTLETATGILEAAEDAGTPALLLVSDATLRRPSGTQLLAALVAVTRQSRVSAGVQLDHCPDLDRLRIALDLGATAIMADGSRLDDEANARFVRQAVRAAEPYGAAVEAELGRIEGHEDIDIAAAASAGYTDPAEAERFVERTGADCLAVSIGNVHGTYQHPPQLDWPRLSAIVDRVPAAIALHGTSGLPAEQVSYAQQLGVVKFNLNTELRRAYLTELRNFLTQEPDSTDMLALTDRLRQSAHDIARAFPRVRD
ncbi:fructose-bisphosphate aldolase [Tamaricihabitans halophyticus]|uniref:Fructose-bisphosphate aldolase n=1 Tax=Tamaricihabitans halophyticus TaxID=1262583 RepID=A0A4R2PXX3_9PSEU|nr:class II fructose-bisphosphate aldolase [Tamaricihabitans halophyticus]TCP39051.1 fructose-bisphosphate aldolase [Tamaricihabitans halophyticus]